nr:FHA domain-containing serine/threonine-protein kinase [uncultured Anaerobutyricum sp.]
MEDKVWIKCIKGKAGISNQEKEWEYEEADNVLIGRSSDNKIVISNEGNYMQISRYQAELTVRPPQVYIKDFGSKNGTFVNNECIGHREKEETPEEGQKREYSLYQLRDGDKFSIGGKSAPIIFQVKIEEHEKEALATEMQELEEEEIYRIDDGKAGNAALVEVGVLGEGGFGAVYLAEDVITKKKYAIKKFKPEVKVTEHMIKTFKREADILEKLEHPNVVKVFKNYFDVEDQKLNVVMEYCSGGDLQKYINAKGDNLSIEEATQIMLILLDVLDYIHNIKIEQRDSAGNIRTIFGIVHRDIKPQNILFTADGTIKLTDFGLAKAFDLAGASGVSSDNQWAGTMQYVSRRQIRNYRYSKPDVDIFSITALYYYLLTGYYIRDFTWEDVLEPQPAVLKKRLVPIRERDESIPVELAEVIDNVLKEEDAPENSEFTTAEMLSEQIRRALNLN